MLRRVGATIICFEHRELKVQYNWLVLDIRDERRSTLGACRSVAFPRGPEGSLGGSRGTSLSSHYRTGGYPCEGEAFCCTVKEVSSHEDRNNNLSSSFGDLLGDWLLPRNC
ncbi:hypothetical protein BHE74_00033189 [Ensete ventricosum]|nr:hypothetical protein BHE74_00033189 [Ensete ventricosum]